MGIFSVHDGSGRNGGGSQRSDARKTRNSRPASERARSQRSSLLNQRQNAWSGGTTPREVGSAHPHSPAQRQRFANSSRGFARPQVSGDRSRRQSRARPSAGQRD